MSPDVGPGPLEPGRRIRHYRVIEEILPRGGMSLVYRAQDEQLLCDVALKIMDRGTALSEARAIARMNHPAIVVIHQVEEGAEFSYIVMQLVAGESLDQRLKRGILPEREVLRLGVQLAQGLAAAHENGVIHRDLKPGNLRITQDGWLKIMDFGLAKRTTATTQLGDGTATIELAGTATIELAGTLPYIAPEIWKGSRATESSDVYGAGLILYEMAVGPLPNVPAPELALKAELAPRERNQAISNGLDRIIRECLAKEPSRRPSAKGLAEKLQSLQRHPRPVLRAWSRLLLLAGVLALMAVGYRLLGDRGGRPGSAAGPPIRSLAVVPFRNLTGDSTQQYIADGMTDELTSELGAQDSLRVIWKVPPALDGQAMPEIRRVLGVQGVVSGSVYRSGSLFRIKARLVDSRSEKQLWSGEDGARDVLEIAGRFSKSIVEKIGLRPVASPGGSDDAAAVQFYLEGRSDWRRRTPDGVRRAISHFESAIQRDSLYAEAFCGLADALSTAGHMGILPPIEAYPRAKRAALRALELNESLSEAYVSLANIRQNFDWDWEGAGRDFRRAIELNDNNAVAHHWYSNLLAYRGQFDPARREIRFAQELDPVSMGIQVGAGAPDYFERRYDAALAIYQQAARSDSMSPLPYRALAGAYYQLGRHAETANSIQRWIVNEGYPPAVESAAMQGYRSGGIRGMARALVAILERAKAGGHYVPATHIAELSIAAGDHAAALQWLGVAWDQHDTELNRIKVDPIYDPLRADPRFAELLRKTHLEP